MTEPQAPHDPLPALPADLPYSPAADRNKAPILAALQAQLPATAQILEIASGTGQHAAHFAAGLPGWRWQPSEHRADALPVIATRCAGLANVAPPIALDLLAESWPGAPLGCDAIYCANVLHIAPWAVTAGLMRGAACHLRPGGRLCVYGPFVIDGLPTAPSNLAFDADLRERDPAWGLRRLTDVHVAAVAAGLVSVDLLELPANNRLVVWTKPAG
jgi:SAM-dependent methyltransferase